jgi:DNA repair protein RadD
MAEANKKEKMIELRDYQKKAVNDVFDYICNNKGNPVVISPTGSGKSILIAEIIRKSLRWWPSTRILMLTHQKELIEQDMDKLKRIAPDLDIGVYSASLKSKDASHDVTFASIQSICKNTEDKFNVVLVDECHLINNNESGNYRSYLGMLNCRVIGFTATPYRLGQGMIVGDDTIFDHYIETISILEMQRRGYLSRLYSKETFTKLDVTGVSKLNGEYKAGELDKKVNTLKTNEAVVEELSKYITDKDIRHMIVFCTSVEHAYAIKGLLSEKDIPTVCVEGAMDKATRERSIEEFTSGRALVATNVNVLSIGFDYPEIDCVVMLRPTLSTALYVQQAGRGLRITPNKNKCLLLDFAGNVRRHGPIGNLASIPRAKSKEKGNGVPPMKTCPECLELLFASATVCPTCGHEFPKHRKEFMLFLGDVNGDEEVGHIVESWTWLEKTSKKNQQMWLITYNTQVITSDEGKSSVKEYLVYDEYANPYARRKAYSRMKELSAILDVNVKDFTDEDGTVDFVRWGKAIANNGKPAAIVTMKDGDFSRITATFSDREIEEGMKAEAEENRILEETRSRLYGETE